MSLHYHKWVKMTGLRVIQTDEIVKRVGHEEAASHEDKDREQKQDQTVYGEALVGRGLLIGSRAQIGIVAKELHVNGPCQNQHSKYYEIKVHVLIVLYLNEKKRGCYLLEDQDVHEYELNDGEQVELQFKFDLAQEWLITLFDLCFDLREIDLSQFVRQYQLVLVVVLLE